MRKSLVQKKKERALMKILIPAVIAAAVIGIGVFTLLLLNRQELTLTVDGESHYTVEYGERFEVPEASALFRHTILPIKRNVEVKTDSSYDPEKLGTYTIRYLAEYKGLSDERTVTVQLVDTKPPVITLQSDPDQKNGVNTEYQEEGFSAVDNYDGDITDQVERAFSAGESPDGKTPESTIITYTVRDSSGNETSVTREVIYTDMPPEITLLGDSEITLEVFTPYEEPGYTAQDDTDGDLTEKVTASGLPDTGIPGDYEILYSVTDSLGQSAESSRTVLVRDTTPPEITLVTNSPYTKPGTVYQEEGYSAFDNVDGDITALVEREEHPEQIIYRVADQSGNTAEAVREIIYRDVVPPQLTLGGEIRMYLPVGTPYTEPGYSAVDDVDGDITDRVQVSGGVDSNAEGIYTLTYSVADQEGNTAAASREVFMYRPQQQTATENPGSKTVYLTFDDGPGPYTEQLLAILDEFNVKATFFVTNQFPPYQGLIGEAARRGHTVAVHTLSHRYEVIYASEEAYWNDFNQMNAIIEAQTGQKSNLLRFPGGTSNEVSKNYCAGIMTALSQSADRMGIRYCDWNVVSGDADGGQSPASTIAQNVINGIQAHDVSIVLQHDIWPNSVAAVREILSWGLANGYTFLPITESTPLVHQAVQN
ncbi:MAG: DUF5011 domain-containing protein [Lachnospiraceae bacterium]|nr:DUF5011 domain-containing protein [Lachnospiraceae bacterium]